MNKKRICTDCGKRTGYSLDNWNGSYFTIARCKFCQSKQRDKDKKEAKVKWDSYLKKTELEWAKEIVNNYPKAIKLLLPNNETTWQKK